ncbi:MAG: hypothetical protein ACRDCN_13090, partial [Tannerellaceae bacterium]
MIYKLHEKTKNFRGGSMGLIKNIKHKMKFQNKDLIVVDLVNLSNEDKVYIKETLVEMCRGKESTSNVSAVAVELLKNMSNKGVKQKAGITAEFFISCIVRQQSFEQIYCFENLEENSAKKGFDGVFANGDNFWLTESKSSYEKGTHNYKHKKTIDRAYNGISDLMGGRTRNNPWRNAVSHARVVTASDNII